MTPIRELREAVEAGEATYDQFHALCQPLKGYHGRAFEACHDGSVDAALALLEAVLPGWSWMQTPDVRVGEGPDGFPLTGRSVARVFYPGKHGVTATAPTPARALLIAILKAMEEREDDGRT